ncbi:MAG: hypothetical protein QOE91_727 [Gaiellaceae bacterium]|nr:hypothetical protein [Gaiellaceae bacterium]
MTFRFCDELAYGCSWIAGDAMQRCSHALVVDGRVWVVDPVAWPDAEERIRSLGEPAGVVQLLDRHNRDCAALAERLGVPHLRLPDVLPPFEVVRVVDVRGWHERALWWPERRLLVVAEAVGTNRFYLARGERLAVHPLLRLTPPRKLARFEPAHLLVGHGEGVHDDAAAALHEALRTSRRRVPRWIVSHLSR